MVSKGWEQVKIREIADELKDSFNPKEEENKPYIGLEHVEQQTLMICGIGNSKETTSLKKIFYSGDILFGRLRPYFRKVVRPKFDGVCSGEFIVIKAKKDYNQGFLFYLFANNTFVDKVTKTCGGIERPRAQWSVIKEMEVMVPNEFNEQQKIATILSNYDTSIENNNRRIQILEKIAKLIYDEWFVKFRYPGHENVKMVDSELGKIPEGWEVKKLGDKIKVFRGKTITKRTISSGKVPVVAGGLNPAYYHNESNAKGPIITVSASGANAGFTRLYFEDIWASDCSYINCESTSYVYYYYMLMENKKIEINALQRGSAQPHVYAKDLMRLEIIDPAEKVIINFEKIVNSIFNEIACLTQKNQNLSKTRDLLLPKLISGQIDVSELDIKVPEVET